MPPVVPQPGFPPPQGGSGGGHPTPPLPGGAGGGGVGPVTPDMLQREQDYQDAIRKRNQLLLDPNPVRAMEALREATRKAADEEERLGRAIRTRLALAGQPVPLPVGPGGGGAGGGGSGPGTPPNPYGLPPTLPPGPKQPRKPPGLWDELGDRFGLQVGRSPVGTAMNLGAAAVGLAGQYAELNAQPFLDERTRITKMFDSIGMGPLRELIAEMQVGGDVRRNAAKNLAFSGIERQGAEMYLDIRHQRALDFIDRKAMVDARYTDPNGGPIRGATVYGLSPLPDQARDTPLAALRYAESRRELPHEDAYRQSLARVEAEKLRLARLRGTDEWYARDIGTLQGKVATEQQVVKANQGAGDEGSRIKIQNARIKIAEFESAATKLNDYRLDLDKRIRQTEMDIARATFEAQRAKQALGGSILDNIRAREGVATEQSQRLGGMGPGDRMQGMVMLRQLQEMEKQGADLSVMPRELFDMAGAVAPETVAKMRERAGASFIDQARQSGALPEGEFRDKLSTVRGQADAIERGLRDDQEARGKQQVEELYEIVQKAFRTVLKGQLDPVRELIDGLKRKLEIESFMKSN